MQKHENADIVEFSESINDIKIIFTLQKDSVCTSLEILHPYGSFYINANQGDNLIKALRNGGNVNPGDNGGESIVVEISDNIHISLDCYGAHSSKILLPLEIQDMLSEIEVIYNALHVF